MKVVHGTTFRWDAVRVEFAEKPEVGSDWP
jgi:hypothetical protein